VNFFYDDIVHALQNNNTYSSMLAGVYTNFIMVNEFMFAKYGWQKAQRKSRRLWTDNKKLDYYLRLISKTEHQFNTLV